MSVLRSLARVGPLMNAPAYIRTLGTTPARLAGFTVGQSAQRRRGGMPTNTVVNFVPQQQAWVVERMGKFHAVLEPGLRLLLPFIDTIRYVHSLKEIPVEIPSQSAITQDNVTLHVDAVLYLKILDPFRASYGVEDPQFAVAQLAQTTMRSELGKLPLDHLFRERAQLNEMIVKAINDAAEPWGVTCLRCEIRDIMLPDKVVEDMQRQVSAERRKRASILESEGQRQADINVAEGRKASVVLASEARMQQQMNEAQGEAAAIKFKAEATAIAIANVAEALKTEGGHDAVALQVAQQYVEAFGRLAKETNTLLLPTNASDPAAMVAQAMSIFHASSSANKPRTLPTSTSSSSA